MVLAFHEPEDYLPPERWLRQFEEKSLGPGVQLRRDIHGISGATLSSQAVTNAVRLSLALFQLLIQERH
jgi:Na+-translocating ferredoxin:NAD+ oxidoreductase RnfG subunit